MASATVANSQRWPREVGWIATRRMFSGVRVNIGLSDLDGSAIAVDPNSPNFDNLNLIFDLLIAARLKCQLGIGGDGPPNNNAWRMLASGTTTAWSHNKRPPKGVGNGLVDKAAEIKSAAIGVMFDRYAAAGLDPFQYCAVEMWNEPARGGAGAPPKLDPYWTTGTLYDEGTWDSPSNDPSPSATDYTTFAEYMSLEAPQIDFRCLPIVAPSFTSAMLDQSTNGLAEELLTCLDDADDWLEVYRSSPTPTWGINCYYGLSDSSISLGARLFANRAVNGRDLRLESTSDKNAIIRRLAEVRTFLDTNQLPCRPEGITICEAGVQPTHLGMSTTIASRSRKLNYFELGRARLEYLDRLRQMSVDRVILYTASDTSSTAITDRYGAFTDDLGTTNEETYSAEIPFSQRAGISTLTPYAGASYLLATEEVLPPRLT